MRQRALLISALLMLAAVLLAALLFPPASGQVTSGSDVLTGTTLPAGCSNRRKVFNLTATSGANQPGLYRCTGTVYVASGGSGDTLPVADSTAVVKGSATATKLLRFEVDGFTAGQTRVVTPPDANTSLPVFSQTVTFSGPTAARTVTLPDSNFTAARTDAGQTFSGQNVFSSTGAEALKVVDGATNVLEVNRGGVGRVEGQFYDRNGVDQFAVSSHLEMASGFAIKWHSVANWFGGTADTTMARQAAGIVKLTDALQLPERSDPPSPSANNVILYARDNGSGKTQIVALFPTGAAQVMATEP